MSDLTVVVTCHESDGHLKKCLDSILDQGAVRIVLVDDGSRDCACFVLAGEYPEVEHLVRTNGGHGAALNTGIARVMTAFISFLDDDDQWCSGRAARHLDLLAEQPVDAVVGGVTNVWIDGDREVKRESHPPTRLLGATTFRTDAFRRVGPLAEDRSHHVIIDWWSRAEAVGFPVLEDPIPALMRRIDGTNSGIVHRDDARRDLMHHLRTHVSRRTPR